VPVNETDANEFFCQNDKLAFGKQSISKPGGHWPPSCSRHNTITAVCRVDSRQPVIKHFFNSAMKIFERLAFVKCEIQQNITLTNIRLTTEMGISCIFSLYSARTKRNFCILADVKTAAIDLELAYKSLNA
jgi:hypothetical protein